MTTLYHGLQVRQVDLGNHIVIFYGNMNTGYLSEEEYRRRVASLLRRAGMTAEYVCRGLEITLPAVARMPHGLLSEQTRAHLIEYAAYRQAWARCQRVSHPRYKDYGGRGIKFLFVSFEQFLAELGPRPEGRSLDREDNDGNYEPGNVRWATARDQANNQRRRTQLLGCSDDALLAEVTRRGLPW